MRFPTIVTILFLLATLTSCASPTPDWAFVQPFKNDDDMGVAWKNAGVQDPALLTAKAASGDQNSLRGVLILTTTAHLDGASAQSHASLLGHLLHHVGDRSFAEAVRSVRPYVRSAVADRLSYALAEEGADVRHEEWFKSDYPLTWRALGGSNVEHAMDERNAPGRTD